MIDDDEQYEDFTSGAPLESKFSDRYLRLTDDFCCNNGNIKLIRWIGCKPGVYNGSTTLFLSNDLALCNWSQQITNYNYTTISFSPVVQEFVL